MQHLCIGTGISLGLFPLSSSIYRRIDLRATDNEFDHRTSARFGEYQEKYPHIYSTLEMYRVLQSSAYNIVRALYYLAYAQRAPAKA